MQKDFTEAGKTFKKGRRLPIRNLDQYQNFRVRDISELDPQVRHDWEIAKRKKPSRATNWQERKTGRIVYVIKEPAYLTSLSVRLRNALTTKAAEYVKEDGKILYVKDFRKGMPYYDTPTTVEEK